MTVSHDPSSSGPTDTSGQASDVPDIKISVRQTFGIDTDMQVPAFSHTSEHVPEVDDAYRFDRETTLAILAGFTYNRRVLIQGYHGTGKSTHIEQVAAQGLQTAARPETAEPRCASHSRCEPRSP